MSFIIPVWLLLLVPLGFAWYFLPMPSRFLRVMRACIYLLLILALAQPIVYIATHTGTIIALADRSVSLPQNAEKDIQEGLRYIHENRPRDSQFSVISFGESVGVENIPYEGRFSQFSIDVGTQASDLAGAMEKALQLTDDDENARFIVLSDGLWTGRDPLPYAARVADRGYQIDFRHYSRAHVNDLAIQSIDAPLSVTPGEAWMITAWINAPIAGDVYCALMRRSTTCVVGKVSLHSGINRLSFNEFAVGPGAHKYTLHIASEKEDPVEQNNTATFITTVQGTRPILLVSDSRNSGLAQLLRGSGLDVITRTPQEVNWSIDTLAGIHAVVLENVPANTIGTPGMTTLEAWTKHMGGGIFMTGGKNSYGRGGYYKSVLEPVLPVTMELRKEHRKTSVAVAIALDRSGSMGMPAAGGLTKMDLANISVVEVMNVLTDMDEIGVIAVDSEPHKVLDIAPLSENYAYIDRVKRIKSGGGGIFVYEALSAASFMLSRTDAGTRHIILFADAADSEHPWKYKELIKKCADAGMTISVVGLGTSVDKDVGLLEDIARRGGGEFYLTRNPSELPRLFVQDTFTIARSTFLEETVGIKPTAGMVQLLGTQLQPPSIDGYNLCYARPEAILAAYTTDDINAPVVAGWQYGSGRVVCYTGEADGQFAGQMAQWDKAGEFYAGLTRYVIGGMGDLPANMMCVPRYKDGLYRIELHLDPSRDPDAMTTRPTVTFISNMQDDVATETLPLSWETADLLVAERTIDLNETVAAVLSITNNAPVPLPPVCAKYPAEFIPADASRGISTLQTIAEITGGSERDRLSDMWDDIPRTRRGYSCARWLILLTLCIFFLEIIERRTQLVSFVFVTYIQHGRVTRRIRKVIAKTFSRGRTRRKKPKQKKKKADKTRRIKAKESHLPTKKKLDRQDDVTENEAAEDTKDDDDESSQFDAFRSARRRAQKRTKR